MTTSPTGLENSAELEAQAFDLTPAAIDRIAALLAQEAKGEAESKTESLFRVAVLGGGCSGFQYQFSIDTETNHDDRLMTRQASSGQNIQIAVDEMSLEFLKGSQLDYIQELIGSYFQVSNPNATASCGCGTSFAI